MRCSCRVSVFFLPGSGTYRSASCFAHMYPIASKMTTKKYLAKERIVSRIETTTVRYCNVNQCIRAQVKVKTLPSEPSS